MSLAQDVKEEEEIIEAPIILDEIEQEQQHELQQSKQKIHKGDFVITSQGFGIIKIIKENKYGVIIPDKDKKTIEWIIHKHILQHVDPETVLEKTIMLQKALDRNVEMSRSKDEELNKLKKEILNQRSEMNTLKQAINDKGNNSESLKLKIKELEENNKKLLNEKKLLQKDITTLKSKTPTTLAYNKQLQNLTKENRTLKKQIENSIKEVSKLKNTLHQSKIQVSKQLDNAQDNNIKEITQIKHLYEKEKQENIKMKKELDKLNKIVSTREDNNNNISIERRLSLQDRLETQQLTLERKQQAMRAKIAELDRSKNDLDELKKKIRSTN